MCAVHSIPCRSSTIIRTTFAQETNIELQIGWDAFNRWHIEKPNGNYHISTEEN
jgi:hypothetical protein